MNSHDIQKEMSVVNELIAEEARIAELVEELIDIAEYARHERPVPHARHYKINVDGTQHVVHAPEITGEDILRLAGRQGYLDFEVAQHFRDGRQETIERHQEANLRAPGVERFTTVAKMVQVTIDSRPMPIQAGSYTLTELKTKLSVDRARVLDQVIGGEFCELSDQHRIHIKGGEVFVSHVRTGQSS